MRDRGRVRREAPGRRLNKSRNRLLNPRETRRQKKGDGIQTLCNDDCRRAEIEQLIDRYREGASIDGLARRYKIHRTTVIHHLDQAGIIRRRVIRKMTDESVACAAARYAEGASLAVVASEFRVHQRTLARELRMTGASIRPRRGWHC